jgi:DNA-directed RNA polymerase specialized sigma24 family protein
MDELALLTRIQSGDAEAFGQWASASEPSLRRSLRPFATLVDTEAALQEALLRVWQVAPRFQPDGRSDALLRFSVTTARNCALDELKKRGPTRDVLDRLERELTDATVSPFAPDPLLRKAIQACREKLPPQPRAALEQRLASHGGEDDTTLAQRVRMSLNTFLQNFGRARRLLRECLEKAGIALEEELR